MRLRTEFLSSLLVVLLAASLLPLPGCGGGSGGSAVTPPDGGTSLESYLKDQYAKDLSPGYSADVATQEASGVSAEDADQASTPGYTGTNTQESGVDESDHVKSDGTHLYIGSGDSLIIARAVPRDGMEVVSRTTVAGAIDSIYLQGKTLVVLYQPGGTGWSTWDGVGIAEGRPSWIPADTRTGMAFFDVGNPAAPACIRDFSAQGSLVSSRLSNGMLRVVMQFVPALPELERYYDGSAEDFDRKVALNRSRLDAMSLNDLVPSYTMSEGSALVAENEPMVAPGDYYLPPEPCGGSIVSIASFDLNDPASGFTSAGIVADAHVVYASAGSLYLTSTTWPLQPATDADSCETRILKFDISGPEAVFAAEGRVPGTIINQFSLGEHQGVLHIATQSGFNWGSSQVINRVFCLTQQGSELPIAGMIDGIAPGENIYAVRFMGDKGYVVTYVNIDPLFTLDLSDPSRPVIAGELKVPGYSTYLHPLGETLLLSIGKDTVLSNGTAYYQGLKLSIFDVSTFGSPRELYTQLIGDRGTDSEALRDHKAFTFWSEQGLLAIPVCLYEHQNKPSQIYDYGVLTFTGLYVYRVSTGSGFEYLGRISTADSDPNQYWWGWVRGLFIGGSVYAVDMSTIWSARTDAISSTISALPLGE